MADSYAPGSKWRKHRLLLGANSDVRACLPETGLYSKQRLRSFIGRHGQIFIKPVYGTGGKHILQVRKTSEGAYRLRAGHRVRSTNSLDELHRWIEGHRNKARCLIQQGIDLATWRGRPVDIRVFVQRNQKGKWEVTGRLARRASRDLAVTNVSRGGSGHPVGAYLSGLGYGRGEQEQILRRLDRLAVGVARYCGGRHVNATYGLDVGLDRDGHPWLIELNTVPHVSLLKRLKQKRIYSRARKLWLLHRSINEKAKQLANGNY
ncbi:YheC/YheD family protein [Tumebacillus sp. DT12]|uniref:YheC/YheD family protein n=1 Tax=Tumebacillus lacus TaxID=2995335 RepID=A0ABT3WXA8_9BACL|nr:YheC/YheD family protein [Tumebacillus lacus]MCX7568407.1 YheC/YheD family protein [Tumebacillus lacus]